MLGLLCQSVLVCVSQSNFAILKLTVLLNRLYRAAIPEPFCLLILILFDVCVFLAAILLCVFVLRIRVGLRLKT